MVTFKQHRASYLDCLCIKYHCCQDLSLTTGRCWCMASILLFIVATKPLMGFVGLFLVYCRATLDNLAEQRVYVCA
jgi:hypothetical protein